MVQNRHTPPQKKILRLVGMMKYLMRNPRTVDELMAEFGMSRKGVYRYLNLLTELDMDLDQDFQGRYFITDNYCPVCEREHNNQQPLLYGT